VCGGKYIFEIKVVHVHEIYIFHILISCLMGLLGLNKISFELPSKVALL
jgi:hypothetical protein